MKKNLHPKYFKAKIFFNGNLIFEVGSTKEAIYVDIWSGNHPFYTNSQKVLDTEGRISKFEKKYLANFNQKSKYK